MNPVRLVLADVDGTLLTREKVLTPRAIAAVESLRAAGIGFAITSGRPPRGLEMLIAPLDWTLRLRPLTAALFHHRPLVRVRMRYVQIVVLRWARRARVQESATYVTGSSEEEGFASAIDRFILKA